MPTVRLTDYSPTIAMVSEDIPVKLNSSGYHKRHLMTLVIALACENGVVFASDGLAGGYAHEFFAHDSELYQKFFFVAYPTCKISSLGDKILWGAAGSVDILQSIEKKFGKLPAKVKNKPLHDLNFQKRIKEMHHSCVKEGLEQQEAAGATKEQLLAAELLLVSNDVGQVEPIKIWYVGYRRNYFVEETGCGTIGDGTFYAQMSLLNFRSNLTSPKPRSKSLSVEQGCLVVYRAVKDAIETGRNIVGPPIDIWTIKDEEKPNQLSGSDKEKLEKAYIAWQEAEISILRELI